MAIQCAGVAVCACLLMKAAKGQRSLESMLAARPVAEKAAWRREVVEQAPVDAQSALQQMFAAADIVFTGEVTAVTRKTGCVEVRFTVENAVRGVRAGDGYTLQEWAGLWNDGDRYVVGERKLMLLHAPSAAGMASPVSGTDGAIPLSGSVTAGTVDLRWVNTHARRTATGVAPMAKVRAMDAGVEEADAQPMESTDSGVVLGLLHAWQREAVAGQ